MKHKGTFVAILAGFSLLMLGGIYGRRTRPVAQIQRPTIAPAKTHIVDRAPVSPNAVIYYLLDVSRSFYTQDKTCLYTKSVNLLDKAAPAIQAELPAPQRHVVGLISSYSRKEEPVCDFTTELSNPFHAAEGETTASKVKGCIEKLKKLPTSELSDIHGAIAVAAEELNGHKSAVRAMIIFSDLDEDYKGEPGRAAARADLQGACVLVYYEDLRQTAIQNPSIVSQRAKLWHDDLVSQGAQKVQLLPLRSYSADSLADFLRQCK